MREKKKKNRSVFALKELIICCCDSLLQCLWMLLFHCLHLLTDISWFTFFSLTFPLWFSTKTNNMSKFINSAISNRCYCIIKCWNKWKKQSLFSSSFYSSISLISSILALAALRSSSVLVLNAYSWVIRYFNFSFSCVSSSSLLCKSYN